MCRSMSNVALDAQTAFSSCLSSDSEANKAHQNNNNNIALKAASLCPIAACSLAPHASLLDHLVEVHEAQVCEISLNEDGRGAIEADTPVVLGRNKSRRSTLIIRCSGSVFLWSLESRSRADGEEQVSVTMRSIDDLIRIIEEDDGKINNRKTAEQNDIIMSEAQHFSSSSSSSSSMTIDESHSSKMFAVSLSVLPSSSSSRSPSEQQQQRSWGAIIDTAAARSWPERQEHLVSKGDALICLYPSHAAFFSRSPSNKDGEMIITVRTEISLLGEAASRAVSSHCEANNNNKCFNSNSSSSSCNNNDDSSVCSEESFHTASTIDEETSSKLRAAKQQRRWKMGGDFAF